MTIDDLILIKDNNFCDLDESNKKQLYKTYIELVTEDDVDEFTNICKSISEDVFIKGKDEYGSKWEMNAKSLLNSLLMKEIIKNKKTKHSTQCWLEYNLCGVWKRYLFFDFKIYKIKLKV